MATGDADSIFRDFVPRFLNRLVFYVNRHLSGLLRQQSPRYLRLWVLFAVLVAVMQLSDPIGDVPLSLATLFWCGRLFGVAVSLIAAEWILAKYCSQSWNSPPWLKPAIILIVIAAIPMTAVEVTLENVVPQRPPFDDSSIRAVSPLLAGLGEYLTVLTIVLPINVLLYVFIDMRATAEPATEPAILARANGIALDDVIAIAAEEHYVRVHAKDRSELVYSRFSDAVSDMPESIGTRVHRSWWVADTAVVGATRGTRRYQLELKNGELVPVSDRYLSQVRDRGLLIRKRVTPPVPD